MLYFHSSIFYCIMLHGSVLFDNALHYILYSVRMFYFQVRPRHHGHLVQLLDLRALQVLLQAGESLGSGDRGVGRGGLVQHACGDMYMYVV